MNFMESVVHICIMLQFYLFLNNINVCINMSFYTSLHETIINYFTEIKIAFFRIFNVF